MILSRGRDHDICENKGTAEHGEDDDGYWRLEFPDRSDKESEGDNDNPREDQGCAKVVSDVAPGCHFDTDHRSECQHNTTNKEPSLS